MRDQNDELAAIVDELIELLYLQAQQLETLITQLEHVTSRLPAADKLSAFRSGLSALHLRITRLRGAEHPLV